MVNNYMKELCNEGFLEYRRRSSKNASYHLTILGRETAEATQHELLRELVKLFADAKARVREAILGQVNGTIKRVVIYGSGDLAELAFHALEASGINVVGVCDDDLGTIGHDWCGRQVLSALQIRHLAPDAVLIADPHIQGQSLREFSSLSERGVRLIILDGCTGEAQGGDPHDATLSPQTLDQK